MNGSTLTAWIVALVAVAVAVLASVVGYRLPACAAEDGGPYPCLWRDPDPQGRPVIIVTDD